MVFDTEFRVLIGYFAVMYLIPVIRWRKTRRSSAIVGTCGERQNRARWVATLVLVAPLLNYVLDGPWPWYADLNLPAWFRWSASLPATLALLWLVWACRATEGSLARGPGWFIQEGPYRWQRHPQLLASSIFFLSLSVVANNAIVFISTIAGIALLRLVLVPAVEADMKADYGSEYERYCERTGVFFLRTGRVHAAQYTVPRQFGLSAVLALTTVFAILFGVLNYMKGPPVVYLFVSTEIAAICLVQIIFGTAPRSASALTGAVLLPFWTAISLGSQLNRVPQPEMLIGGLFIALFGALIGYCVGALAAGFFLAVDMLEPFLPGAKHVTSSPLTTKHDEDAS